MNQALMILMASFYILAGLNHFRKPSFYQPMMPPYIPNHSLMISLSGIAEILLGILLFFEPTKFWAAMGIIAMLTIFLSVHIYMIQTKDTVFKKVPSWILYARIPLQFGLIFWAYQYL